MGAQNFNFASKVTQNSGFQLQILHFWTKIFRRKETFPTAQNFRDAAIARLPLPCCDATASVQQGSRSVLITVHVKWKVKALAKHGDFLCITHVKVTVVMLTTT